MYINIKGAKENNLKNVDLQIPKNKLVVFTGLSGSGKSTMALQTLQRECQRQYMESMGMTMNIGSKPNVDSIEGLSPAISINQHQTNHNPRSTVGTITEISSYLRVLFSKLGERPCTHCHQIITQNYDDVVTLMPTNDSDQEEEASTIYEQMIPCPHCGKPQFELTASHFSFNKPQGACPTCHGIGIVNWPDVQLIIDQQKTLREFAVYGWDQAYVDRYGASIVHAAKHYGFEMDIDTPICNYNDIQMDLLLYGVLSQQFCQHFPNVASPKTVPDGRFEGVITNLMRRYSENSSASASKRLEKFMIQQECPTCKGVKFRSEILEVKVNKITIQKLLSMSLYGVNAFLSELPSKVAKEAMVVVSQVVEDLRKRIDRILDVGAGYLSLDQPASTLSAGEWQRIKLALILGSGLTGVLYVLDEPTSGLHSRDTEKIIHVLHRLRDIGNTVVVIEHDLQFIRKADYIIDFGPGAGRYGGEIVACGTVEDIMNCDESITGKYLKYNRIDAKSQNLVPMYSLHTKRSVDEKVSNFLSIKDASENNLKHCNVEIPLHRFVTVTGVSGSGKSSLIFQTLAKAAESYFHKSKHINVAKVAGFEHLEDVVIMNQQSIGRSNRSNAATYTEVFTDIRDLYASLPKTKANKLTAKHFSYNVAGGRCEKCQGNGKLSISMHFLPDVEVICPVCSGKRFHKSILDIKYKGYSISDVLDMSIEEAIMVFSDQDQIASKLRVLKEVGLGYLGLGQSATTLSGGEAQRLKLAKELSKNKMGRVLYLFDEPTNGLHPHDAQKLLRVFHHLVDLGNSVIAIEHNTDLIMAADWVIDLGPEGGIDGGEIVAQGTPKDIMNYQNSVTGKVLARLPSHFGVR